MAVHVPDVAQQRLARTIQVVSAKVPVFFKVSGAGAIDALARLCVSSYTGGLRRAHRQWVEPGLTEQSQVRQAHWTESIAV